MHITPRDKAVLELLNSAEVSMDDAGILAHLRMWEDVGESVRRMVRQGLIRRSFMEYRITPLGVLALITERESEDKPNPYLILDMGRVVHSAGNIEAALDYAKRMAVANGRGYEVVQRVYKVVPNKGYTIEDYT